MSQSDVQNYKVTLNEINAANNPYYITGELRRLEMESLKDESFVKFCYDNFYVIANKMNLIDFIDYVKTWIFNNVKYLKDQYDETLISPRFMIFILKGDCDDFAVFCKTILKFFAIDSDFILLGRSYGEFSHIALTVRLKDSFLYVDPTRSDFNVIDNKYKYLKYF